MRKYIYGLAVLFLISGCTTQEEFYLQNNAGYLEGPFRIREGKRVLDYTVRLPGKDELALINKLKNTVITEVDFNDVEISVVVEKLNKILADKDEQLYVKIFLDIQDYENRDLDIDNFLSQDGFEDDDPFADYTPDEKRAFEKAKKVVPKINLTIKSSSMYDVLKYIAQIPNLHLSTQKGICILSCKK